jgi:hypothetical protein
MHLHIRFRTLLFGSTAFSFESHILLRNTNLVKMEISVEFTQSINPERCTLNVHTVFDALSDIWLLLQHILLS